MAKALRDCDKETNPDWYELAQSLRDQGIPVLEYTSLHTGKPEGFNIQEQFNRTKRCVLIASTLACGEGLDLQTCADSMMHERQWNPQNEDQAAPGRFKRIGQTSSVVNVTFPEAEGTIDEDLDDIVSTKRRNFHNVMNTSEHMKWSEDEIGKELAKRIVARYNAKKGGKKKLTKSITNLASLVPTLTLIKGNTIQIGEQS